MPVFPARPRIAAYCLSVSPIKQSYHPPSE